jgi:hypothetical protein
MLVSPSLLNELPVKVDFSGFCKLALIVIVFLLFWMLWMSFIELAVHKTVITTRSPGVEMG